MRVVWVCSKASHLGAAEQGFKTPDSSRAISASFELLETQTMKLLVVIPYCANDAVQAERLCDHVYRLNGKMPVGNVLLVVNPDVHQEMRMKVRIAAELAYETVEETVAPKVAETYLADKFRQMNNLFRHAAMMVMHQFRWPWIWLEPDCVPVKKDWINQLAEAYDSQPRKYLGLIASQPGGQKFMARCGVYFTGASFELDKLCQGDAPFPLITSVEVVRRATGTNLIQYHSISTITDLDGISSEAVVVHGDKLGIYAEKLWRESTRTTRRQVREQEKATV